MSTVTTKQEGTPKPFSYDLAERYNLPFTKRYQGAPLSISKRYLTPMEASEYSGIPYETLIEWYYNTEGPWVVELPAFPDQRSRPEELNLRYDVNDLDAFLEHCKSRISDLPDLEFVECIMECEEDAAEVAGQVGEGVCGNKTSANTLARSDSDELRACFAALRNLPWLLGRMVVSTLRASLDRVTSIAKGVLP